MSLIKTVVPNEIVLNKKTKDALKAGISDFIARTEERRIVVLRNRRYAISAVSIFLFSIGALFLAHNYLQGPKLNLATMYLLGLVSATFIFTHRWYRQDRVLKQELYLALVPIITSVFSRLSMYTHDIGHRVAIKEMIQESGILPDLKKIISAEDIFVFFEPFQTHVRKVRFEGKKKTDIPFLSNLHDGILVDATLPKTISGQIFAATNSGRVVSSSGRFWNGLESVLSPVVNTSTSRKNFIEIVSTNTIEAETFFNFDMIDVLSRWWEDCYDPIRLVVKGNKIFIYFPNKVVKLSNTSTKEKDLLNFATAVVKPIWRILATLEEVR